MFKYRGVLLAVGLVGSLGPASACDLSLKQTLESGVLGGIWFNAGSEAMWPTMKPGERFFASVHDADGPEIVSGDIVVFCLEKDPGTYWVKRVVGLPGERITINANQVAVNGKEIRRTPVASGAIDGKTDIPCFTETLDGRSWQVCQKADFGNALGSMPEKIVPPGELFVLGDNRDNSLDSRLPTDFGRVLLENVVGIVRRDQ